MKTNKDQDIKFRLTAELKEKIQNYCQENQMSISEFARYACEQIFKEEIKDEN